jgi:hypothetical protein
MGDTGAATGRYVHLMRRPLMLAVFAVLAAAPASARANTATLWACHGPTGAVVPFSFASSASSDAWVTPQKDACRVPGDSVQLGFVSTSPLDGHFASLRFNPPAGVSVDRVWLGRRVVGPGYWARTSAAVLESLDDHGSLDGVFSAPAGGFYVEVGIRCETDPMAHCDTTGAGVDLRFAALTLRDEAPPTSVGAPRATTLPSRMAIRWVA